MTRDSFVFYRSFAEAASAMDVETKAAFLDALCAYALDGEDISEGNVSAFMALVKPQIDANNQRFENGKKGGKPKANQTITKRNQDVTKPEPNRNQTETKAEPNVTKSEPNVNVDVNVNENVDVKEKETPNGVSKQKTPTRHRYGEYDNVLLSDDEMEKLKKEFPGDWEERIERLSEGIASKGYSYRSHLATIRSWARRDQQKQEQGKSPPRDAYRKFQNESDYFSDEIYE